MGGRDVLDTTLLDPVLIAEVSADRAVDHGGIYRPPHYVSSSCA
ncbi:hypothetical protein [Streptomyces sp. NPDC054958]